MVKKERLKTRIAIFISTGLFVGGALFFGASVFLANSVLDQKTEGEKGEALAQSNYAPFGASRSRVFAKREQAIRKALESNQKEYEYVIEVSND